MGLNSSGGNLDFSGDDASVTDEGESGQSFNGFLNDICLGDTQFLCGDGVGIPASSSKIAVTLAVKGKARI